MWGKIFVKDNLAVYRIGQEISKQAARLFIRHGLALPARIVLRRLMAAIKEDRELFKQCVKLAKDRGFNVY